LINPISRVFRFSIYVFVREQMVTTQANPHSSKSNKCIRFPITNIVDKIVDTSRLVGSQGNVPFVLEPVEHMS